MILKGKEGKEREAKENLGEWGLGHEREEEERKNIRRTEGIKIGQIRERNRKITKSRLGGIEPDSMARKE